MWTIGDVVARNARKFGDRPALMEGEQCISFAELDALATQAAGVLQGMGVEKGHRVAIMGRNTVHWVAALLGTLRAGAVAVPVNHKLAAPEVAYVLSHSDPKVWLFDGDLAEISDAVHLPIRRLVLDGGADGGDSLAARMRCAPTVRPITVAADDLAEILYTSGTTGKPKGCMHSHATILLAGIHSSLVYSLGAGDRALIAMPVWHAFPLNNLLIGSFYVGGSVVLLPEYHPTEFLRAIERARCTVFFGAPIAYLLPLKLGHAVDGFDLSSVRAWLYGAGPIDPHTLATLREHYRPGDFYQLFGMTETGPAGMALLPDEHTAKAGSIGRWAGTGCDVMVMKSDSEEAAPGEVGEIWMKSQSVMLGYFRDPQATAAAFSDGWYKTGDLVRVDEDGFLTVVDRLKDMIVTGGENVYSKEVEDVLLSYPGVGEVGVVGQPDGEWGEIVVSFIIAAPGLDVEALRQHCLQRLAKYKVPREFRILERMPRTPTGKVMKYALRQMLAE